MQRVDPAPRLTDVNQRPVKPVAHQNAAIGYGTGADLRGVPATVPQGQRRLAGGATTGTARLKHDRPGTGGGKAGIAISTLLPGLIEIA